MKVLIDDERNMLPSPSQPIPDIIARNVAAGMLVLIGLEVTGELQGIDLYLDHDLGEIDPKLNGTTIMNHIEVVNHKIPGLRPRKIVCVSSNPYGRGVIEAVVKKIYGRTYR